MIARYRFQNVFFVFLLATVVSCGQNGLDDNSSANTDGTTSYDISGDADGPETSDAVPPDTTLFVTSDAGDDPANGEARHSNTDAGDVDRPPVPSTSIAPNPNPPTSSNDENPTGPNNEALVEDPNNPVSDDATEDPAADGRVDIDFPPTPLTDLESGDPINLEDLVAGENYSLLWFWSPASPTSEREAPVAQRLANRFPDTVSVLAIAADGDQEAALDFRQATGLTITTLWASTAEATQHYEVVQIPSSILLDNNGDVIARWPGLPEEAFRFIERVTGQ